MPASFAATPLWDDDQLRADRDIAANRFTDHRREEGPLTFARTCGELRPQVEAAFTATDNLRALDGQVFLDAPLSWQVFRYVCAPPVSQEDLWTLVGAKFQRGVPPGYAQDTADALRPIIDPVRFPWVDERRDPTVEERERALLATTVLWSAQWLSTTRRGAASVQQEAATGAALAQAGFTLDVSRKEITVLDEIARGEYSKERKIAGAKCDVPARLRDGRLLALECKVSNGPKNGWKRVVREVGGKADGWRGAFGNQIVTGVVLAGVFDISCLKRAQNNGVMLIWEHNLDPLANFVSSAGQT